MKLEKENWFKENRYNNYGYEQIQIRLIFLEREYKNLNNAEKKHEINVIKYLTDIITHPISKSIYFNKLEMLLNKILTKK